MSKFYNPKRYRNIFDPASKTSFKLSRSKIDNFLACPKCFYLDRRLGVSHPPGFPFNLNKAVDTLLKKEFDIHRAAGNPHPLMKIYKIDAIPFKHENMEKWRDALSEGIQYFHEPTNFIITGAIDDIWINPKGELIIVDYKATSKSSEVNLDSEWQDGYKRQMEIYQWLFRKNDFKVSDTSYFVYCNGDVDKEAFDGKLEFDIKLLPYKGDDSLVEAVILKAHKCLMGNEIPKMRDDCDFCQYRKAVGEVEK